MMSLNDRDDASVNLSYAALYRRSQQMGANESELLNIYNASGLSACNFESNLRLFDEKNQTCKEQDVKWKNKIKEKLQFEKEGLYL